VLEERGDREADAMLIFAVVAIRPVGERHSGARRIPRQSARLAFAAVRLPWVFTRPSVQAEASALLMAYISSAGKVLGAARCART